MKHEIVVEKPDGLQESWLGQYSIFSWLDYVITFPNIITLVTTNKENGKPNAALNAWGMLLGSEGNYSSLIAVGPKSHTFENIKREKEWCVCIPSAKFKDKSYDTIKYNGMENDEVTDAGLTVEAAKNVKAPRIVECSICLECQLSWDRPLAEGDFNHIFAGRVVHVSVDDSVMDVDPAERIKKMNWMYNIRSTVHPLTLENGEGGIAGLSNFRVG